MLTRNSIKLSETIEKLFKNPKQHLDPLPKHPTESERVQQPLTGALPLRGAGATAPHLGGAVLMIHMRTGASPLWGAGAAAPHLGGGVHDPPHTECGTQREPAPLTYPVADGGSRGGGHGQNRCAWRGMLMY